MSKITHPTARSRGEADRAEAAPTRTRGLRPANGHDFDSQDSYAAKQRSHDARYRREYEAWVASLPPEERRQLAAMGLEEPQMPHTSASGHCDAAERSECVSLPEIAQSDDEAASDAPPSPADNEAMHNLLRRLLGELLSRANARLSIECLALVTGLAYDGDSMSAIAARYHVTRAAVSRRCVDLSHALHMNPCRAMRSLKARQSYRRSRINHLNQLP